jgi:ATP-dependent DNA ligase
VSRNGVDHTRRFSGRGNREADRPDAGARGEVAIYDQQLRSRFDWLREPDPDAVASPSVFMAFDLLNQDRRDRSAGP